jgi:hypothetical protein
MKLVAVIARHMQCNFVSNRSSLLEVSCDLDFESSTAQDRCMAYHGGSVNDVRSVRILSSLATRERWGRSLIRGRHLQRTKASKKLARKWLDHVSLFTQISYASWSQDKKWRVDYKMMNKCGFSTKSLWPIWRCFWIFSINLKLQLHNLTYVLIPSCKYSG